MDVVEFAAKAGELPFFGLLVRRALLDQSDHFIVASKILEPCFAEEIREALEEGGFRGVVWDGDCDDGGNHLVALAAGGEKRGSEEEERN
jgi:hypothetical protein